MSDKIIHSLAQIKNSDDVITSQQVCYSLSEAAKFFEERQIQFYGKDSPVKFYQVQETKVIIYQFLKAQS